MRNKRFCLFILFATLIPHFAFAQQRISPHPASLTVSVFNDAGVAPSVLADARIRADLILRRAGIALSWLDCGTPGNWLPNSGCTTLSYPQHLSVRLVSKRGASAQDTFGQSFQDAHGEGNYAVIYFGVLASSKSAEVIRSGDLLGFVIAHELGHLLLGLDSHSPTGLMCPLWQSVEIHQAARGNLFFTEQQQERIRSRFLTAAARLNMDTTPAADASSGK
jgi:hypothetical protein